MTRPLSLRLFGGFQLEDADGKAINITLRKAEALLAYLALVPGQRAPREKLATLLWGEAEQQRARQSLRQTLLALTKALARSDVQVLRMESQMVSLIPDSLRIDAVEMARLLEDGSPGALVQAAALYQGELIAGLVVDAPDFEDWLTLTRGRLHDQALKSLIDLLNRQMAQGDFDAAIDTANQALRVDAYREDIHRQLMQMYIEKGMRSSALAQFRVCREVLERELGVQPDEQTVKLYKSILEQGGSAPSVRPSLPVGEQAAQAVSPIERADYEHRFFWGERPIGRDHELHILDRTLRAAMTGQGGAVAVVGEAGIGKSYLIRYFLDKCDAREVRVVRLEGRQADHNLYLMPWNEALGPTILQAHDSDHRAEINERLLRAAFSGGQGAAHDVPRDDRERKQLFDAVASLLRAMASNSPLAIHFEDLHWADDESLRLLSYCVRQLANAPILFVLSLRADDPGAGTLVSDLLADLARRGFLSWSTLKPLTQLECADLVEQVEAKLELPEEAHKEVDEIWTLSEGNPQVIIEYAVPQRLREARRELFPALFPRRLITDAQHIRVNLSEEAQMLLATACVLGPRSNYRVLMTAADLDEPAAARAIEALVERQILAIEADDVVFVHLRVCRTLYEDLVPPRRRLLHAAAARAIKSVYRTVLELHYQAIAYHAREGGLFEQALEYQWRAAWVEMSRGSFGSAGQVLRQALKTAQLAGDIPSRLTLEVRCHVLLAQLEEFSSTLNRALNHIKTAQRLTKRETGDSASGRLLLGQVLLGRSRLEYRLGKTEAAFDSARLALTAPDADSDTAVWGGLQQVLTRLHLLSGRHDQICDDLQSRLDRCTAMELGVEEVEARLTLALVQALQSDFEAATASCRSALSRAEAIGSESAMGAGLFTFGVVLLWSGSAGEAVERLGQSLTIAEATGDLPRIYLITGFYGLAQLGCDRQEEGLANLQTALDLADRLQTRVLLANFKAALAEAWPESEDESAGKALANSAVSIANESNQPWARSLALRAMAVLMGRHHARQLPDAEQAIQRAVVIQRGLQLDFEVARSLALHAKIARARGDTERAITLYEEAGQLYRGLGQTGEAKRIGTLSDALRPTARANERLG